jgi:hypothetical protein
VAAPAVDLSLLPLAAPQAMVNTAAVVRTATVILRIAMVLLRVLIC